MGEFTGFREAALDFYDDLEVDNTKAFWDAHKDVYKSEVAEPVRALLTALEPEFGPTKIFRPYRDVRFTADKTPYKTHQGAFVPVGPSTGYYLQVGAAGVLVGVGFYEASSDRLAKVREAIDNELTGRELERILAALESSGWKVGGDAVKTAPRGYDVNHPRIELLRHRSFTIGQQLGFDPVIHTAGLVERVARLWRDGKLFLDWVARATAR